MAKHRRRTNAAKRQAAKARYKENKEVAQELVDSRNVRGFLRKSIPEMTDAIVPVLEQNLLTQTQFTNPRKRRRGPNDKGQKLNKQTMEAFCVQKKTSLNELWIAHALGVHELSEFIVRWYKSVPEGEAYLSEVPGEKAADHALRGLIYFDYDLKQQLLESIWDRFTPGRIIRLLSKNKKHRDVAAFFVQKLELRDEMSRDFLNNTPDNYADLFPETRMQKRHFILHIGPTNSGKTHEAMEQMKRAETGVYLAPLRLLAYEQYERMTADGLPCSMITGEERIITPFAGHQASTIEMLDLSREYDVAVIDEGQMCADAQRGGAWTNAILGVRADIVHVCAAENSLSCLIRMIRSCKDDYEIIRHKRMTALVMDPSEFSFPEDVQDGDAFIVFSRIDVHGCAYDLREAGVACSIIYGALPYDVRHKEAEKFATGQTRVLVATDAIGMGLNLPIRRIVFLQQVKFDGRVKRKLTGTEVKQIAGRAGRYGLYDTGLVQSYGDKELIEECLNREEYPIRKAVIKIPPAFLDSNARVSEILEVWNELPATREYEKGDIEEQIQLAKELEEIANDKELVLKFISFSIDAKDENVHDCWAYCYRCMVSGQPADMQDLIDDADPDLVPTSTERMQALESAYRMYDFLYAYAVAFEGEDAALTILQKKRKISEQLLEILDDGRFQAKRCRRCGRRLPWIYPFGVCDRCFKEERAEYGKN